MDEFTQPFHKRMMQHKLNFLKKGLTGLNTEFSFSKTGCHTNVKEPSLHYYLPIVGGRKVGFLPFPKILPLCKMQKASFRIWTLMSMSISNDNNHYIMSTSVTHLWPKEENVFITGFISFNNINSWQGLAQMQTLISSFMNNLITFKKIHKHTQNVFPSHS